MTSSKTGTRQGGRTAYALLWYEFGMVNTLVYRPPSGPEVRTYFEGHLDSRAGDESSFPRFDDENEALWWMANNQGKRCLVALPAAKRVYGRKERYAEPI